MKDVIENLIMFSFVLSYRRSFQNVLQWDSTQSNLLVKILQKAPALNKKYSNMKNLKTILNRWIESLPNEEPRYNDVVKKFFEYFFDPKVTIPNKGVSLYTGMKVSRVNTKLIAE